MSRSTYLTTKESPSTSGRRFHHSHVSTMSSTTRTSETVPMVIVQSNTLTDAASTNNNTAQHKSIVRINPKFKRNLRDKRRATGIRADEVSLASTPTDGSTNEEDDEIEATSPRNSYINMAGHDSNESFDHHQTMLPSSPPAPVFTVSRVHSSFDKLSLGRSDPYGMTPSPTLYSSPAGNTLFRSEEFILRRQPSDDDPATTTTTIKHRSVEERILTLESLVYDKDSIIHDLQRKLDKALRDLADAEQQIYALHKDKLTLIKAFTSVQDTKSSTNELSKRTGFVTRN